MLAALSQEEASVARVASIAVVIVLSSVVVACGGSDDKKSTDAATTSKGCPKQAASNSAYSSAFEGDVSMDKTRHVLRVTRDGKPVSGASVCVNAAMAGMKGMRYTATAKEIAPGRYEVGVKFGMKGDYRGNVVTRQAGDAVSTPVTVKVRAQDTRKSDSSMSSDMKTHTSTTGAMRTT
jgi:hypothetical protein